MCLSINVVYKIFILKQSINRAGFDVMWCNVRVYQVDKVDECHKNVPVLILRDRMVVVVRLEVVMNIKARIFI